MQGRLSLTSLQMWAVDGSLSALMFQTWLFINSVKCDKESFGEYAADAL